MHYLHVFLLITAIITAVGSMVQANWANMALMLMVGGYASTWLFKHQE